MAVSGRKFGRPTLGSAKDLDICCDPCKHLGQSVEAKGFCVNCQENLCKRCVHSHKGLKLCRNHQIFDQPQKSSQKITCTTDDSKVCTKYCDNHKEEIIRFFCQEHDRVGCSICMTLDHRTCRISFIPDICSGTLNGKEFSGTLQKLSASIKEADSVVKICQVKKDENKTNTEVLLKEIKKYQKKIKVRIDKLKQQLVKEANSHKSKQDQNVNKVAETCAGVSSELKQIHAALLDCQTKNLEASAFVTMKKALSILNTTKIQMHRDEVTNLLTDILFEPNDQIKTILSQPHALGRISMNILDEVKPKLHTDKTTKAVVKTGKETKVYLLSIEQMYNIDMKTKSDKIDCDITGGAVISDDKLLLADYVNCKLKVVNIDTHSVVEEISLDNFPWDITVLPEDQAAVSLPPKNEILIVGTAGKLSEIKRLEVGRECWGIVYHKDYLYVVCQFYHSILVLNMQGNFKRDIALKTEFSDLPFSPTYIAMGKDGQTLYISDWYENTVTSLTLHGEENGVYMHDELSCPRGMVVLEDGSLLVGCLESGTIHHVSADLKQGCTLTAGIPAAWFICYHADNGQIYVSSEGYNQIKVFRVQ